MGASGITDPRADRATYREWIGLGIIALPCILYAMDLTVLNLAVPSLSADLKPTAAQLLWVVDIYGFLAAGTLLIMGALGDRIGRRKLLLIGSAAFGLLSLVAAFARSAEMLILARALLGIAGATMAPSTLSLISNMFRDNRQRTFAVSVWVASFSFGGAIGPVVGGLLLSHFWWGAVFLVPIPITVVLLVVGPVLLPEHKTPNAGRLDVLSAALSLAAVLPVIFGIKLVAEGGGLVLSASAVALGLVFGVLFVSRQMALPDPLLDLRLFKQSVVAAALAVNVLDFFVGFGILVLVAQYLQLVLGLNPLEAGLWSIPAGLGFIAGSLLTSVVLKLMRPAHALGFGLALGAGGLALMAYAAEMHSLILIVLGNVLFSIGSAPGIAIVADLVVSAAPKERSGAASALSETASEFGGALGIALLGSLATLLYRSALGTAMPTGASDDAMETALRGIGTASSLAPSLGEGNVLLSAARSAYTSAAAGSFLAAAGIMLLAAIVAVAMLRNLKTRG
ncbi:MFS transporter [Mesorhizobium sp. BH1-1-5]|uniref:MFS transporter n=1 Tax=Mesorhizobium sp. BH1-1-5 TaxID=2876661 RepID=UPI001CCA873A|nr:MFS transporter [Mesorhizobium sp. BH1-1-5]MBZ9987132.1 MFS transporter [Mesorhizobium sp. BH1-1-5]